MQYSYLEFTGGGNHFGRPQSSLQKDKRSEVDRSTYTGGTMNQRKHPRIIITHIEADISDGRGFYTGTVQDISRFGLSISNIPKRLDTSADIYSVILDGPGTHFKLLARPIWEQEDGMSKTIGAQIENSPWTWTEYVMHHEPLPDDDSQEASN